MKTSNQVTQKFINLETISARLLMGATLLALFCSNSPFKNYYYDLFHTPISGTTNLLFWINDALMAIFFLVVGLEIKYELLQGALNTFRKAALPGIGAIGGMLVPAVIFAAINFHDATMLRGWAVPTATDIAFALSVLSLLGSRVPPALKAFLTALAILDDLAAILIIAIFYTDHIAFVFLGFSFLCAGFLFFLNRINVAKISYYLITGVILWFCLLKSGIHPTLAGVVVALSIPLKTKKKSESSLLQKLLHSLHPWVALGIIPLFAFANAGISFLNLGNTNWQVNLVLGVLFGLFIGKQLGIFCASWLAVKFRFATLPDRVRWRELYAVSIICGIGFTISLFIGALAFENYAESYLNSIKMGVLLGSLLSGSAGYLLLFFMLRSKTK